MLLVSVLPKTNRNICDKSLKCRSLLHLYYLNNIMRPQRLKNELIQDLKIKDKYGCYGNSLKISQLQSLIHHKDPLHVSLPSGHWPGFSVMLWNCIANGNVIDWRKVYSALLFTMRAAGCCGMSTTVSNVTSPADLK